MVYEWCHYLIHTDYKPKTAVYRAIWRNHRLHHFKNEHYWFTRDQLRARPTGCCGTYPDPAAVDDLADGEEPARRGTGAVS